MRKERKILGEAVVLLIAVTMVLSTITVMADTIENTISSCNCAPEGLPTPESMGDEETIYYYDPASMPSTCIYISGGSGAPYYWKTAIKLTQDELGAYGGWNLTGVNVFHCAEAEHTGDIIIYGKGTQTTPGSIITTEPYTFDMPGWFRVDLNTSVPLDDHEELWLAVDWTTGESDSVAAIDNSPAVDGKGDWIYLNNIWQELQGSGADFDHNWGIEGIVQGEGKVVLSIVDVTGPIGVKAGIKNSGDKAATDLEATMTVTGGILGFVDKNATVSKAELAGGATESISSGLIIGFGKIAITITADAANAAEVTTSKEGFLLGILVIGIK